MKKKRYFTLVFLFLASITIISAKQLNSSEQRKVATNVQRNNGQANVNTDRSLDVYTVDVWVDTDMEVVTLSLYNIGDAHIYIVDTNGHVINETYTSTDSIAYIDMSISQCDGDFYVIVYSEYIYAEGFVDN